MAALARTYMDQRKFDDAQPILTSLLEIAARRLGPEHNTTMDARILLGYLLVQTGRFAEAESPLRDAVRVRERLMPDTWNLANVRSLLGASLSGQRKFDQAEPLLTAGVQGLLDRWRDIPAASRHFFEFASAAVVQMYRDMGQPVKATSWQTRITSSTADTRRDPR